MNLNGKVALVTGASRGIGAATAKLLAANGAAVIVNYLQNEAAAESVVKKINSSGGRVVKTEADVTGRGAVEEMVSSVVKAFGHIDILVNNANIPFPIKPFLELTWEELKPRWCMNWKPY